METETENTPITGQGSEEDPFIVSNWEQFLEKCNIDLNTYVKFSDDIDNKVVDFQTIYPEGVLNYIDIGSNIDFNNWELRNITTYENMHTGVFRIIKNGLYIKNGIFNNVLLKTPDSANSGTKTLFMYATGKAYIYDSSFNGVFEDHCNIGDSNIEFRFCSFNISLYGLRMRDNSKFVCCNMHIDGYELYTKENHTSLCKTSDGTQLYATYTFPFVINAVSFTDCYVEGKFTFNKSLIGDDIIIVGAPYLNHSVISIESDDAYILAGGSSASYTHSVYNKDLLPKGIFTLDEGMSASSGTYNISNTSIFVHGLTTNEMKDANVLRSVGLPVGSDS